MYYTYKKYGNRPYATVLLHGGPGAAGSLDNLSQILGQEIGVIEALQNENSIPGQINELDTLISDVLEPPVCMIGHSWGSWLAILYAFEFPQKVDKLVLIGCPPFKEFDSKEISKVQNKRFDQKTRDRFEYLQKEINQNPHRDRNLLFKEIASILSYTDSYKIDKSIIDPTDFQFEIFEKIWKQASELRISGQLYQIFSKIQTPIFAIHGDFDPHPYQSIQESLRELHPNSYFHLLENCGHEPWKELDAKNSFFEILLEIIGH